MRDAAREAAGDRDAHRTVGQRDIAGRGTEAADQKGESTDRERIATFDRRLPQCAGIGRVPFSLAAERAVDIDQPGARDDPLDRRAAIAFGDGPGDRLLVRVERAKADMCRLGLDHLDAAAAVEDGDAEPGAGPDDADHALRRQIAGAAERNQFLGRHDGNRVSHGAKVVQQRHPVDAELGGQAVPVDPPVRVHEGQRVALDRRGDGDRGGAGKGAALSRKLGPGRADSLIFASPVLAHGAELGPRGPGDLGQGEAGMGAPDVGRDDLHCALLGGAAACQQAPAVRPLAIQTKDCPLLQNLTCTLKGA